MPIHPKLKPRILLIEDDPGRIDEFREWLKGTPFVLVEATSGGQAMGMLRHGSEGIAGICLDHDLNTSPRTQSDEWVSGSNVVNAIVANVPKRVPILVHSMNVTRAPQMVRRLEGAGFSVLRIRMVALHRENFSSWLRDAEETWVDWAD